VLNQRIVARKARAALKELSRFANSEDLRKAIAGADTLCEAADKMSPEDDNPDELDANNNQGDGDQHDLQDDAELEDGEDSDTCDTCGGVDGHMANCPDADEEPAAEGADSYDDDPNLPDEARGVKPKWANKNNAKGDVEETPSITKPTVEAMAQVVAKVIRDREGAPIRVSCHETDPTQPITPAQRKQRLLESAKADVLRELAVTRSPYQERVLENVLRKLDKGITHISKVTIQCHDEEN
jgi:hypothetical protein